MHILSGNLEGLLSELKHSLAKMILFESYNYSGSNMYNLGYDYVSEVSFGKLLCFQKLKPVA